MLFGKNAYMVHRECMKLLFGIHLYYIHIYFISENKEDLKLSTKRIAWATNRGLSEPESSSELEDSPRRNAVLGMKQTNVTIESVAVHRQITFPCNNLMTDVIFVFR